MRALIRRRCILEGEAYFERSFNVTLVIRGRHLSETQYLLEEIQHSVKFPKILRRKAMGEFLSEIFLEILRNFSRELFFRQKLGEFFLYHQLFLFY